MDRVQELKNMPAAEPCRYCNAPANWAGEGDWHWIECTGCGARGPRRLDPPDARGDWNAAHMEPTSSVGEVERLRAALRFYAEGTNWSVDGVFIPARKDGKWCDAGEVARAALEDQS